MRAFAIAILFILSSLAIGQTTSVPAFGVADVHQSKPSAANQGTFFSPGGRYSARGATMLNLIQDAYDVEPEMIVGGPNWLDATKFDITARPPAATDEATAKLMLQALLTDRFKLQIHKDQKTLSSYVLTVSKRGLKIKESAAPGPKNCDGGGGGTTDITIKCTNMTMADLATQVRQNARAYVDQPAVDKTGLNGTYDYTLSWTGKNQLRKPGEGEPDKPAGTSNTSVFDALDKQLGLKLELQKESVAVIVIDQVNEKPTENAPDVISKLPKDPTEFEVAEIKPSAPGTKKMDINFLPGGRLDLKGVTIKFLLTLAYGIQDDDMLDGPRWIDTHKFDIVAKAPVDLTQDVAEVMLRNLLADRFKYKMHYEERPVQVYALVVSKKGLKIKESAGDTRANCKNSAGNGKRNYTCQNTTMAQLTEKLRQQAPAYIDHPVIDKSGLTAGYDFVLSWTPKQQFLGGGGGRAGDAPGPPSANASDPNGDLTAQEALDRQLGLRLELQKHPMQVMVIDHVEQKPTEN